MRLILPPLLLCLAVGCDPTESEKVSPDTATEIDSEIGPEEDAVGTDDVPVGDLSPFERVQAEVLIPYCANGGCHGGTPSMGNGMLVLDGPDSHGAMVGVEPFNANAREAGMLLVEPGNLENSFLWQKMVLEESDASYGNPMPPFAFEPLSDEALLQVQNWVVDGAEP